MNDPSWVSYLREWPGLVLAGGVIVGLLKILGKLIDHSMSLTASLTEQRTALQEAISLLRQLVARRGGVE